MSATLKSLGIDVLRFSNQREDEAYHRQQSFRVAPFFNFEGEQFNWSNVIAKPELLEIKMIQSQSQNPLTDQESELNRNQKEQTSKPFLIFGENSFLTKTLSSTLRSKTKQQFFRCLTILNIAMFCAYDYQSRINNNGWERNRICITIEIFCNIFFNLEFIAQLIVHGFASQKSWWNIINLASTISSWSILGDINSNNQLIHILRVIRIFRSFRLIQDTKILKKQMDAFVGSFSRLGPILVPLLFVVLYYSILGLHLFMGLSEYRCRTTPAPVDGKWEADQEIGNLCGIWHCPEDTFCGSPAYYDLPFTRKSK